MNSTFNGFIFEISVWDSLRVDILIVFINGPKNSFESILLFVCWTRCLAIWSIHFIPQKGYISFHMKNAVVELERLYNFWMEYRSDGYFNFTRAIHKILSWFCFSLYILICILKYFLKQFDTLQVIIFDCSPELKTVMIRTNCCIHQTIFKMFIFSHPTWSCRLFSETFWGKNKILFEWLVFHEMKASGF